jgi:hypothetical protein
MCNERNDREKTTINDKHNRPRGARAWPRIKSRLQESFLQIYGMIPVMEMRIRMKL